MSAEPCGCVDLVNRELASRNTILCANLLDPFPRLLVATTKLRSSVRGRERAMFASFCPFCGVKYPERTQ